MDENRMIHIASGIVIASLLITIEYRRQRYNELVDKFNKLNRWARIAQRIMNETFENDPTCVHKISEGLANDINFYKIVQDNNLE